MPNLKLQGQVGIDLSLPIIATIAKRKSFHIFYCFSRFSMKSNRILKKLSKTTGASAERVGGPASGKTEADSHVALTAATGPSGAGETGRLGLSPA